MRLSTFMRCNTLTVPLRSCLMALALASVNVATHAATQPPASWLMAESAYRNDLGEDFAAITQWLMSQTGQREIPADEDVAVAQCDLLLKYGMDREAAELLTRLAERGGKSLARDQAWWRVARWRYQMGRFVSAEDALSRIRGVLPASLDRDRKLLSAQLLMGRADYRSAALALKPLVDKSNEGRLAQFNLGVAQIKGGDMTAGMATLDELGLQPVENADQRVLRDRANVMLSFVALKSKQPALARQFLERVPLQGSESGKALLAYGWAAMDQQTPQAALVPWLALLKRDTGDAVGQEVRLAVPFAYEQLGAKAKALQFYADALAYYDREQKSLDASLAYVRSGGLIKDWLTLNPVSQTDTRSDLTVPTAGAISLQLADLYVQASFQQGFKNLIELQRLGNQVDQRQARVDWFNDALAVQRQGLNRQSQQFAALGASTQIDALRTRVNALSKEIAQGESRLDGLVFADARQRELLAALIDLQVRTQKAGRSPEVQQMRDRVRMAMNVLNWQLAQEAPARIDRSKQLLASMQASLASSSQHDGAIRLLIADTPKRLDRLEARLQVSKGQLDEVMRKLQALQADQRTALEDMAVAELSRQKEAMAVLQSQARFAVAKLYDEAAARNGGSKDSKGAADAPKQ